MPITHGSSVDVFSHIDKPSCLDASSQHRCDLIEMGGPESIANISWSEEDVGPGTTGSRDWDTVIIANKSRTNLSELNVTIPCPGKDTKHFSDGSRPIGDPASKEAAIHNVETCIWILKTQVNIVDLP